jgi:hypothetical protein
MRPNPQRMFLLVLESRDNFGIKRPVCRKLRRRLEDIGDLLDKLDAFMLSVNEVRSQSIRLILPSSSVSDPP